MARSQGNLARGSRHAVGLWTMRCRGTPGVPISYRGAGRPPEQGRCALHQARGGGAHRAGPCAAARAGAGRLQGGAAKRRRARCAIFPRRCRAPGARRFNRARAHIPGTDHTCLGGRPRALHAAVPSAALHLPGHFADCQALRPLRCTLKSMSVKVNSAHVQSPTRSRVPSAHVQSPTRSRVLLISNVKRVLLHSARAVTAQVSA